MVFPVFADIPDYVVHVPGHGGGPPRQGHQRLWPGRPFVVGAYLAAHPWS
jgi:hypothetical protein